MINYTREGWRPDPDGVHQYRYHDGRKWTERVGNDGVESQAPRAPSAGPTPSPPLTASGSGSPSRTGPEFDGARAAALARTYGDACSAVLAAAQSALDVANEANGAWNAAQVRPQHEISIRNFTDLFHTREAELGRHVGRLRHAVVAARTAAAELAACEGLNDPETWLLACVEDEVYGHVSVAVEFLRVEIGAGVQGFLETVGVVNAAVAGNPGFGELGFLGNVFGNSSAGTGDPASSGVRNPNVF